MTPASVVLGILAASGYIASHRGARPVAHSASGDERWGLASPPAGAAPEAVWKVEQAAGYEIYSNGLRIDRQYLVNGWPRRYRALERNVDPPVAGPERTDPAGIVYHTTESHQAPFEEGYRSELRRAGISLLEYVRRRRAYHFVIDRFGRVFSVVGENDAAGHAGHSIWADDRWIYLGLNASFLGVAFEARGPEVTAAQVHSARLLTDMLRSRYGIQAGNCVPHAQVSVNPVNCRMSYHSDWAAGFPFAQLGLPDNYRRTPPSLELFGFGWDAPLARVSGGRPWEGLLVGEQRLLQRAARAGMSPKRYRAMLQKHYREVVAALEAAAPR